MSVFAPAAANRVEILDLRHFTSADLRPLLDEESGLWNRLLCWDYKASADMILRYVDAKILPGYAAVDRGTVFGYAFFVYEGNKGVIGDLFVGGKNGTGKASPVELELLNHVIATLQQSPGIHRIEAQLLVHDAGEVARPFAEEGFQRYQRLFMTMQLAGDPVFLRSREPIEGIEIRPWREGDYQSAAGVITAAYRGHIDSEINDQYRTIAGSLRFLNNIVRFPGCGTFDSQASFVAVSKSMQNVVGVILCSRVKEDVGPVTQVCILPEFRGKGIGEELLACTVDRLRESRARMISLTVTEQNQRAVQLYLRLGFEIKRVFDAFVWEG